MMQELKTIRSIGRWNIVFGAVACTAGALACAVGVGCLLAGAKTLSSVNK